ncbi:protein DMP6-like [Zingiber officinale]|uniref:Uncharacterized protein n=1 Tax=Zingiber officinale TaxID=94328 RepID=A0A8J5F1W4_ZINOF|nr:protein DMP6-like [Zingiber officinale]KAG6480187.1 hypothetical protein ZIOFF_063666 [Zingiber officinale]
MATNQLLIAGAGDQRSPLLSNAGGEEDHSHKAEAVPSRTLLQVVYKSTADLANYLPTGTTLAFHVLAPVLTDGGRCAATANRAMTSALLLVCCLSSIVLTLTDSFTDATTGRVRYGLATRRGLLVIDGLPPPAPAVAAEYRLMPVDLLHALMTLLVFVAVALANRNVVSCFYPIESPNVAQVVAAAPVVVGLVVSAVFVAFPSTRHGIGFPVTPK